ncbi:MAG: NAD-dependent epimerase/dehydratase family protein [Methanosarcinales archaeon]|nr:MAG: NAD-dependent epimerase/dehydratase family protein [Methanosarcinales archaeon]
MNLQKKIMVTGCSGFIGTHLARRLLNDGFHVIGYDMNKSSIADPNFEFIQGDILDMEKLQKSMDGCESVFHLAAQTSVPKSTSDPFHDFKTNAEGVFNVLLAAKEQGAKVIYTSTSTVYGLADMPTNESQTLKPISFYGASKAAGDLYCFAFHHTFGLDTAILRLYNVYGPGNSKGVMYDLFKKLERDPSHLEVIGTGLQRKDYVYIDDVIDALLVAYERGVSGEAYNVGNGVSTTVNDVVRIILDVLQLRPEITYTGQSWKGDVESAQADISKFKSLGWHPKVSIEDGIRRTYEWLKD